ncbi:N-acetylglucosaminyldiphosphoundecaprenol N-acetyl-beta-D-mannosaminyltransferase [Ereboglobus sp. PH5-10]|uniref:WecB/TagA/CpsF family glycosyltransferase n=1 Tax=Ereboglobus sp. PH5-10 TaxID=2940629 RepID=UPI0024059BC8|nr:WecB/TagA/CpsF family glycosyltransferase [Ereboglobus sp. PH5-10]MDF9826715.1 N-acetylglucosaminyldiphosphoundecaprenol N-acetyl-beta-D-mannosaminyltransferase [Ereboglobus sp. PH5-10]
MPPKVNVLGVGVSAMNLRVATTLLLDAARAGRGGYVCVTGVHGVSEAQRDAGFKRILNDAFLNTTDGMPLVWLAKWRAGGDIGRVYGPDLMLALCEAGVEDGLTHFFYGGGEGTAGLLAEKLGARFPGLKVAGVKTPPFRELDPAELAVLAARVNMLKPRFFWVGLGAPKQEKFMAQFAPRIAGSGTVLLGVGAAFDFLSGRARQAPRWMRRCGLEWFFRLCMEPRRLWRRYLINNPLFVLRVTLQLLGLKRYPLEETLRKG